jgi:hypothetical protein
MSVSRQFPKNMFFFREQHRIALKMVADMGALHPSLFPHAPFLNAK